MKRQSLHVKDTAIYDQFTKQQVIWTHGYEATDRYVTRNEWGALLLQWPVRCVFGNGWDLADLLAVCCLHCIVKNLVNVVLSFRYFHSRCYKMFRVPTCAPSHLTKGFVDAMLTLYCSFWQKRTEIWVLLGMLLGLQYSPVSIMEVFGWGETTATTGTFWTYL